MPDVDVPGLLPGASVFAVLAWLIVRNSLQAAKDRADFRETLKEYQAARREEIAGLNGRLKVLEKEVETERAARWKSEDARWHAEAQAAFWRSKADGDHVERAD